MKKTIVLTLICLCLAAGNASAQSKDTVIAKNLELARSMMDMGMYGESIALVDDADMIDDNKTALYPYEKAFAYYLEKNYPAAIRQLKKAARIGDASESVYRLLGDCYILSGEPEMAFKAYWRGLDKFPDSGWLCYSIGGLQLNVNAMDSALGMFIEGIAREPAFAPNWFGAALIQLPGRDKAFGMVNGETAICIEPDSQRSEDMSESLFEAYRKNISFPGDTVVLASFASDAAVFWGQMEDYFQYFPLVYSAVLEMAVGADRSLDLFSLIKFRRRFIDIWFAAKQNERWPCALFDYHRALIDAGHFETYNYWLFSLSDQAAFDKWSRENPGAFDAFRAWFIENPIFEP